MPIVLNGSGPITGVTSLNTTVSDTEIGYLDGVTSALQTQINTAGGLVKITDATFSAQSTVSVNNCFTTTYDAYRIVMDLTSSAGVVLQLRWRLSGTDNSTANSYTYQYVLGNGSAAISAALTDSFSGIMDVRDTMGICTIDIYGVALARRTNAFATNFGLGTGTDYVGTYGSTHNQATAYDGFTIYPASGTITGTLRVFGYRN